MKYILIKYTFFYDGYEFEIKETIATKCNSIYFAAQYYVAHLYDDGFKNGKGFEFSNCVIVNIYSLKELTKKQFKTLQNIYK